MAEQVGAGKEEEKKMLIFLAYENRSLMKRQYVQVMNLCFIFPVKCSAYKRVRTQEQVKWKT